MEGLPCSHQPFYVLKVLSPSIPIVSCQSFLSSCFPLMQHHISPITYWFHSLTTETWQTSGVHCITTSLLHCTFHPFSPSSPLLFPEKDMSLSHGLPLHLCSIFDLQPLQTATHSHLLKDSTTSHFLHLFLPLPHQFLKML